MSNMRLKSYDIFIYHLGFFIKLSNTLVSLIPIEGSMEKRRRYETKIKYPCLIQKEHEAAAITVVYFGAVEQRIQGITRKEETGPTDDPDGDII